MTDLQLGLLVIGALAVAGVVVYNRLQERATRRDAERAFGSGHADVLLGASPERREPGLRAEAPAIAMPDPRVDYIVDLAPAHPAAAAAVLELWAPFEHRFGRRAFLAASDGRGWRQLKPGDGGPCTALQAALQLVTRAGAASDAEVLEFRSDVETVAARLKAAIRAPEMREAVEGAQALDRVCAEADIQVALHVLGEFSLEDVAEYAEAPFLVASRKDGVTLTLDVPRTPDTGRAYEAMVRAARHLAAKGGRVVDDNGRELDDAALSAIGRQLEPAARVLAEHGLEPGGELALRVFA